MVETVKECHQSGDSEREMTRNVCLCVVVSRAKIMFVCCRVKRNVCMCVLL